MQDAADKNTQTDHSGKVYNRPIAVVEPLVHYKEAATQTCYCSRYGLTCDDEFKTPFWYIVHLHADNPPPPLRFIA